MLATDTSRRRRKEERKERVGFQSCNQAEETARKEEKLTGERRRVSQKPQTEDSAASQSHSLIQGWKGQAAETS